MKKIFFTRGILVSFLITGFSAILLGQEQARLQTGVQVVVGKFYSDEMAGKRLENDVPFLLNRSLLGNKGLIMVEDQRFGNITVAAKDYTQKNFRDDYQGLDYILFGDVASLKEGFTINAFLYDARKNLIYDLKPVRGDNSTLFDMCTEISKAVLGKIYELNHDIGTQGITFALISDAEMMMNKKSSENDYLTDLLIRRAIKILDDYEKCKVLPYDECVKFNGMPESDVALYLKANGIIHLRMTESKDFVKLLIPTFYLKKDKNAQVFDLRINMPTIPGDYYKEFPFNDFVLNEMFGFVNTVVTEEGNWRLDELMFTSNDPMGYILEGKKYQERSELFLSNYYYYKALELSKEIASRNEIYYELGYNKVAEHRLAEAEEEFKKILATEPENLDGFKGLGIISLEKQDYNDANKKFSFVASQDPADKDIYLLLGIVQFDLGQYSEAIETLKKDRKMNPGNPLGSRYIGLCYIQLAQYDNSIIEFKKLYDNHPEDEDNQYYLSYSYAEKGISEYHNGNYEIAVDYLNRSNKVQPLNYSSNYLRLSLIRLGQYEAAANLIEEEILKKTYDRIDIYYQHALDVREIFLENLDPKAGDEVIRNLMESLKYDDDPLAYYYIGNAYIYLGQIDNGLNYLMQAHGKDPSNTSIHMDLMEAMLMNNRFDESIAFFESLRAEEKTYEVTDRYQALMDYLVISAMKLKGMDPRSYEKELNKFLETGVYIDGWSYDSYKEWVKTGNFSQENKSYLLDLTARMEKAGIKL